MWIMVPFFFFDTEKKIVLILKSTHDIKSLLIQINTQRQIHKLKNIEVKYSLLCIEK